MKKRIAVFASGWASQILSQYLDGLVESLRGSQIDTYLFLCYPSWASTPEERHGEFNILRLPHVEDFDAAIIISNGLEFNNEIDYIVNKCRSAGTPTISLGIKFDGLFYVGVDNNSGMHQLCEHLIKDHGITNPCFLAGSKENADSNLRLSILKEVMKENGLVFDDSRVFYTNWENAKTIELVTDYCKSGKKLPDAFVCANDGVAMSACLALQDCGFSIPNDTLVTGFDNLFNAQVFDPSISSVNQNYDVLGRESGKFIRELCNGQKRDMELIIPSRFVISESCCFSPKIDLDCLRRRMCHYHYADKNADTQLDRKLNYLERMILTGTSYKDIRENISIALQHEYKFEGESFHIVLEPAYEMTIYNSNVEFTKDGYSKRMAIAVSMENGVISQEETFETRELIPDHTPDDKEHFYVFMPIHADDVAFGYVIMCDCLGEIDGHHLSKYQQRLNIALERYHQKLSLDELNRRLTDITRIDALTHVKNRMAYDNQAKELLAEITTGKKPEFAIAMFDINDLKKINDDIGHNAGDAYIINSARLICRTFMHSPVFRIGGDEFLAILMQEDYQNRLQLLDDLKDKMNELQKEDIPATERVSIACGLSVFNPETDTTIEDVFNRADAVMYQHKQLMKSGKAR